MDAGKHDQRPLWFAIGLVDARWQWPVPGGDVEIALFHLGASDRKPLPHSVVPAAEIVAGVVAAHEEAAAEDEQLLINHRGTYAQLLRELIERMWKRLSRPGSADLLLVGMASAVNHPEAGHVVSGEMATRCPRILQGVIQAGIQNGEFRAVNPEYLARAIAATVIGMVIARQRLIRFCQDAAPPPGAVLNEFLDLLEKGIGNRESERVANSE